MLGNGGYKLLRGGAGFDVLFMPVELFAPGEADQLRCINSGALYLPDDGSVIDIKASRNSRPSPASSDFQEKGRPGRW